MSKKLAVHTVDHFKPRRTVFLKNMSMMSEDPLKDQFNDFYARLVKRVLLSTIQPREKEYLLILSNKV